ncbi:hypothetical protein FS749_006675 [Ceratobasidium sp. UAMH 11750]|nr:hypothetical protein FS749_006675 [Ceratobasidium sp. UAMH 11750]
MIPAPPEIILGISHLLSNSKATQAKLALLNRNCYRLVTPSVYRRVEVLTPEATLSLFGSIYNADKDLGSYVESLYIDSPPVYDSGRPSVPPHQLQSLLDRLVNLQELHLMCDIDPFLGYPSRPPHAATSRLKRLVTLPRADQGFRNFLERHSGLEYLEVVESPHHGGDPPVFECNLGYQTLPELAELIAPARYVESLVSECPAKKVDILFDDRDFDYQLLCPLANRLEMSPRSLVEMRLRGVSFDVYYCWVFIRLLEKGWIATSLRRLTMQLTKQAAYHVWEGLAETFGRLSALEFLELESLPGQESDFQIDRLGRLQYLGSWKACCKSLQTVEIFGTLTEFCAVLEYFELGPCSRRSCISCD